MRREGPLAIRCIQLSSEGPVEGVIPELLEVAKSLGVSHSLRGEGQLQVDNMRAASNAGSAADMISGTSGRRRTETGKDGVWEKRPLTSDATRLDLQLLSMYVGAYAANRA